MPKAKAEPKPKPDTSAITSSEPPKEDGGNAGGVLGAIQSVLAERAEKDEKKAEQVAQAPQQGEEFADVIRGKVFEPPKIMVYGIDGVGKSSFCAQAPSPIFLQAGLDKGLEQIGPPRLPVSDTYDDFIAKLERVALGKHDFATVVIDNLSAIEALIYKRVCQANKWPVITYPGFDRGEKIALREWLETLDLLNQCHSRGMCILLVAHARRERLGDPENPTVEQYAPALHTKTSGELFRKWVDATFFLTRRMIVKTEGSGLGEKKIGVAVGADGGERIIRTAWTPSSVAKNRYDMPAEIPFPKEGGWDSLMGYLTAFYQK